MMRSQKGITLVALVITIIVMLILVGVSVTVAINGGLFDKAKDAKNQYEEAQAQEAAGNLLKGEDGNYLSINDVIDENK